MPSAGERGDERGTGTNRLYSSVALRSPASRARQPEPAEAPSQRRTNAPCAAQLHAQARARDAATGAASARGQPRPSRRCLKKVAARRARARFSAAVSPREGDFSLLPGPEAAAGRGVWAACGVPRVQSVQCSGARTGLGQRVRLIRRDSRIGLRLAWLANCLRCWAAAPG